MENVKTAVSIQKSLFEQAKDLARKMKVSRSRLFVLALEDYIRRQQNRELLAQIGECIGSLSPKRVRQILDGIKLVIKPREPE